VEAFVRFESEGRLQGHGGCNGFFGAWRVEGGQVAIGPLGATRMECGEPAMSVELPFFEALQAARHWKRARTELTFADEAGTPLIRLIQRDWD
jgi:heat shock protein HslJ